MTRAERRRKDRRASKKARTSTNYAQLKTIYQQRKNHRLPEWREFCKWILTLPEFKELTGVLK